ncbi:MAG: proton-conducting membrane transporter [Candidatus Omnitrophica bacterium CG07_land_8_20_14_0_80_42_15]|uniref:Proton-conducting membrane transporter n=1 Tax=Candidatus Aquitaenariimonas noxiae TaxID=1974741 RepID=A0A2J0KSJ9_9BACT|nr:MAG: proton-conducting membrane transporter [Candidatus Omnitrophica bacterium CG07_land_8_20_14_0_80_42_15]
MTKEEDVQNELVKKFDFLKDKVKIQRSRRIFADVAAQDLRSVLDHMIKNMGFSFLCTITGLDEGSVFGVVYHLSTKDGMILNLKIRIPKDKPTLETITEYFPSAEAYERELMDLFGMQVEGLPKGSRYPLPDDWPAGEFPLRKGWKSKTSKQEGGI